MQAIGKVVAGIATVGTIGGVGAYAGGLFDKSKSEIEASHEITVILANTKDRLEKEGFELLSTAEDSDEWKKILDGYVKAKTKTFTGSADTTRDQPNLRSECEKQLKLNTEKSYELARQWCVKEKSVSDILEKGYTLLNTTKEEPTEKSKWTTKVEELRKTNKEQFKKLKALMKNTDEDLTALRDACGKLNPKTIKTTSETFGDVFEKTKEFCAVKK